MSDLNRNPMDLSNGRIKEKLSLLKGRIKITVKESTGEIIKQIKIPNRIVAGSLANHSGKQGVIERLGGDPESLGGITLMGIGDGGEDAGGPIEPTPSDTALAHLIDNGANPQTISTAVDFSVLHQVTFREDFNANDFSTSQFADDPKVNEAGLFYNKGVSYLFARRTFDMIAFVPTTGRIITLEWTIYIE